MQQDNPVLGCLGLILSVLAGIARERSRIIYWRRRWKLREENEQLKARIEELEREKK